MSKAKEYLEKKKKEAAAKKQQQAKSKEENKKIVSSIAPIHNETIQISIFVWLIT